MDNDKKCDKYEGMFVFHDEKDFYDHLEQCPDCKEEHQKYLKISKLVKEAAPLYFKKEHNQKVSAVKRLACCFIIFTGLIAFTGYKVYDNYMFTADLDYDSYITALGLPTDDYGFLDL